MKKMSFFLKSALVLALLFSATISQAQWADCIPGAASTKPPPVSSGTEFLLCFMENEPFLQPDISTYQEIYVASLGKATKVTITCKQYPTFKQEFDLPALASQTYRIPFANSALIHSNETIDQTVIKVVSTEAIACYGMNHKSLTADAFLALPKNVGGLDFIVMAYENSFLGSASPRPSEFCVAAFEDNTTVTITPICETTSGTAAHTAIPYVLNAGECVQVMSNGATLGLDLTGSTITSNKPVVVYGGHVRAETPVGYTAPNSTSPSRDHLCEAIPPTNTWGRQFITRNFNTPDRSRDQGDVLRVLALNDGTTVKINGIVWGQPLKITTNSRDRFRDTLIKGPVIIDADKPVIVGMFAHSATSTTAQFGDPFFAIVPPIEQSYTDFTFFSSNDPVYTQNFVIVVTEKSGVGKIKFDGLTRPALGYQTLPGTTFGGKEWAMETIAISAGGIHQISTPNAKENGVTILAYGFGDIDSYGYTAGALLQPLRAIRGDELNPTLALTSYAPPKSAIRNILAEKLYLDSAVFTHSAMDRFKVKTKKNIAFDVQYLEMGQRVPLDLEVFPPNTDETITGTMRVYSHTNYYRNFEPVDVPFTIYPQSLAGVHDDAMTSPFKLSTYPNPATSARFNLNFTMPEHSHISVRLVDPAGRVTVLETNKIVQEGENSLVIDSRALVAGVYTCEILAPELGKSERKQIVILK